MNAKDTIKRNFSRYAMYYDAYSSIQNYAGSKLASTLHTNHFTKILDIGCGTGNYTKLLRKKFPHSNIKALDMSNKMITLAQHKLQNEKIEFIVADAETAALGERFDLITSNACFQWFGNLEAALLKFSNLLNKNGAILFSTFGPLTFCQLRKSFDKFFKRNTQISSKNFLEKHKTTQILEKYFDNVLIEEQIIKQTYPSLLKLLNTIKYTGTRGTGLNGQSLNKGMIAKLEKIYKEGFKNIVATYQIFYCRAQKKGQSK